MPANPDKPWLFQPGQSGNPGGRPKAAEKIVLEKLAEQGMEAFTDAIVKHIKMYTGEKKPPDDVMWFLERIWPKVSHLNVADTTQRTEAPKLDEPDDLVTASAKMLANLASPNIESDLPVQPGTEEVKQ